MSKSVPPPRSRGRLISIALVVSAFVAAATFLMVGKPNPIASRQSDPPRKSGHSKPFAFDTAGDDAASNAHVARSEDLERDFSSDSSQQLVPEEWEKPLFDVLLMDKSQGMPMRNERLLDLATNAARDVPTVQRECLRHLAFGLSDNDEARFLEISTNPVLPVDLRAEFLKETLVVRPPALGEWLSRQLGNQREPQIGSLARRYLLNLGQPQPSTTP